jgi:transcriptional regulator of met regulon
MLRTTDNSELDCPMFNFAKLGSNLQSQRELKKEYRETFSAPQNGCFIHATSQDLKMRYYHM